MCCVVLESELCVWCVVLVCFLSICGIYLEFCCVQIPRLELLMTIPRCSFLVFPHEAVTMLVAGVWHWTIIVMLWLAEGLLPRLISWEMAPRYLSASLDGHDRGCSCNTVVRSRNLYTSSAVRRAWYVSSRGKRFYDDFFCSQQQNRLLLSACKLTGIFL